MTSYPCRIQLKLREYKVMMILSHYFFFQTNELSYALQKKMSFYTKHTNIMAGEPILN